MDDQLYYSPSTGGFYSQEFHGENRPADCVSIPRELHQELMNLGEGETIGFDVETQQPIVVPPAPPTDAQLQADGAVAIQKVLEALAKQRGYDSLASACKYAAAAPVVPADDPTFELCEKFRREGNALQAYAARVWAKSYLYLATVEAGTNPMPTPEEAVAMMPAFTWPD